MTRCAADEAVRDTLDPISSRLVQLVNDANRLLSDAEGVPSQYRTSADELINECKNAIIALRDAPKNHPSVEVLSAELSSAENVIPILEERANNWDEFVRVRDEVDTELNRLRQPLDEVLTKSRRSINDTINDFNVISAERKNANILDDKVRTLQELSELLDPLESAYADMRFIDVDVEQTSKQYDDLLNELSTEIEDEKHLRDSVDHFINEMNSICSLLTEQPTKECVENIERFQLPALQAQLSMLQQRHNEANNTRKHVDPDMSQLSVLNDRMSSFDVLMKNAQESIDRCEQERLFALLTMNLSQLETIPLRELTEESLVDIERELENLPKHQVDQLRNQIDELKNRKRKRDETTNETLDRFAMIENIIATLPSSYDIDSLEANLARIRHVRELLAELSPDVIAEEKMADRIENTRHIIDDLTKRNEDELQKLSQERDLRNNTIELLDQLEQDVLRFENTLPFSGTSSTDFIDFQQANIPNLLRKLDAISDVPIDLLPKKNDISNRIDIISRMIDDQLNEMLRNEEKTKKLQDIVNECNDKLKAHIDVPIPIENLMKNIDDLSIVLVKIDEIPQEDLASRNQLARDINNVKEQVKVIFFFSRLLISHI